MRKSKVIVMVVAMIGFSLSLVECRKMSLSQMVVKTASVTDVQSSSAKCGGEVSVEDNAAVFARGVCWSNSQEKPTIQDNHTSDGSGVGSFTSEMTNLTHNTKYYVRAYATNADGTAYGEVRTFTTLSGNVTVMTNSVSNVQTTTATCGGNVSTEGGTITARGVCWGTSSTPTIEGSHTTDGSGTGSFTSNLTGLTRETLYYVRAYATTSQGTTYGDIRTFTTSAGGPTVTTNNVSNIAPTSATCGGNVTSQGDAAVTARGVCWSTSSNPTVAGSHTTDGSGTGSFTSHLTGLQRETTYYICAYATNSIGTSYGEIRTFTTLSGNALVTTSSVANITMNSATCGGNVTTDGGASITARGVCWSTSSNPTIASNHTTDGTGTGAFTSNLTGLERGATYYVRAYATNAYGTVYGVQQTFTTESGMINGHEYVDLGLSVKWATCNVGATNPEDYGNYYAWGEVTPKEIYADTNSLTTGNTTLTNICGNAQYDAARANWGGTWRLPSKAEFDELIDNCTYETTTLNGQYVLRFTSNINGNSIVLPQAGYWDYYYGQNHFSSGYFCWTGTPYITSNGNKSWCFRALSPATSYYDRCRGMSVRPVSN